MANETRGLNEEPAVEAASTSSSIKEAGRRSGTGSRDAHKPVLPVMYPARFIWALCLVSTFWWSRRCTVPARYLPRIFYPALFLASNSRPEEYKFPDITENTSVSPKESAGRKKIRPQGCCDIFFHPLFSARQFAWLISSLLLYIWYKKILFFFNLKSFFLFFICLFWYGPISTGISAKK